VGAILKPLSKKAALEAQCISTGMDIRSMRANLEPGGLEVGLKLEPVGAGLELWPWLSGRKGLDTQLIVTWLTSADIGIYPVLSFADPGLTGVGF
jgi:hypothetical protein